METSLIIFLSVFAIIILLILSYFVIRYLKGTIKINLNKTSFSSGEEITGSVHLKTKKVVQGNNLIVTLEARRKERRHNYSNKGGSSTHWVSVYSQEQVLEGERQYPAGFSNVYNISLKVPTSQEMGQGQIQNEVVKTMLNVAKSLGMGKLYWRLNVRLDANGVDLVSSKNISVNILDSQMNNQQTIQN